MEDFKDASKDAVLELLENVVQGLTKAIISTSRDTVQEINFIPPEKINLIAGSAAFRAGVMMMLADNQTAKLRDFLTEWIRLIDSGEAKAWAEKLRAEVQSYDDWLSESGGSA